MYRTWVVQLLGPRWSSKLICYALVSFMHIRCLLAASMAGIYTCCECYCELSDRGSDDSS